MASGLLIERLTIGGQTWQLGVLSWPVTLAWIVGLTNAFNLIDGIDGLAAGIAVIAGTTCAAILIGRGHVAEAMLLVRARRGGAGLSRLQLRAGLHFPRRWRQPGLRLRAGDDGDHRVAKGRHGAGRRRAAPDLCAADCRRAERPRSPRTARRPHRAGARSRRQCSGKSRSPIAQHIHHRLMALGWSTREHGAAAVRRHARAVARCPRRPRDSTDMRRVLLVQPSMQPPGGGNGVAAWMLQALAREHHVTVLSWRPSTSSRSIGSLARPCVQRTSTRSSFRGSWSYVPDHLPVPGGADSLGLLMRYTRRLIDRLRRDRRRAQRNRLRASRHSVRPLSELSAAAAGGGPALVSPSEALLSAYYCVRRSACRLLGRAHEVEPHAGQLGLDGGLLRASLGIERSNALPAGRRSSSCQPPWNERRARLSRHRALLARERVRAHHPHPRPGPRIAFPDVTLTIVGHLGSPRAALLRDAATPGGISRDRGLSFVTTCRATTSERADGAHSLRHPRHARRAFRHGASRDGARRHDRLGPERRRTGGDRRG